MDRCVMKLEERIFAEVEDEELWSVIEEILEGFGSSGEEIRIEKGSDDKYYVTHKVYF